MRLHSYWSRKQENDVHRNMEIKQYFLTMRYVDKKSWSEKLFHHTHVTKVSKNKIYEQNCSMLQMLTHLVQKGFCKLGVFCT